MAKKRRRRNQKAKTDAMKVIMALLLVVAAVFVVIFVKKELDTGLFGLFGGSKTEESKDDISESESSSSADDGLTGFKQDENGNTYYISDDGERLYSSWLSEGGRLYYFNEDGIMQESDYEENGMRFSFDDSGVVSSIRYISNFRPKSTEAGDEAYYSVVKNRRIWAYLDRDEKSGSFYLIKYKRTTDSSSYDLGGTTKQYSSAYSLQLDEDYVYFLPYTDTEQGADEYSNKNLYRVKAGGIKRELIAEDVDGYKVVDGDIYYEQSGSLYMTREAKEDTTLPDFSQVTEFKLEISEEGDKLYLYTADGRPVTLASSEFKAGNFTYELASDGEILSVKDKSSVSTGGYVYTIEQGESFERTVSRVIRTDADGKQEVISSEFDGSCGNLHYDTTTGNMYAEYKDNSGKSRILKITKDGDVDYLSDNGSGSGSLVLYGLQDNKAICLEDSGDTKSFVELRTRATVPLALSVDPVDIDEIETETEVQQPSSEVQTEPVYEKIEAPTEDPKAIPEKNGPGTGIVTAPGGSGSGGSGTSVLDPVTGPGGSGGTVISGAPG